MHLNRGRVLAVGGLAGGSAAAIVAVLAALSAPSAGVKAAEATLTSRSTAFGTARVRVQVLPAGTVCWVVTESAGNSRSCRARVGGGEIGFAISPRGIGGVAGSGV